MTFGSTRSYLNSNLPESYEKMRTEKVSLNRKGDDKDGTMSCDGLSKVIPVDDV